MGDGFVIFEPTPHGFAQALRAIEWIKERKRQRKFVGVVTPAEANRIELLKNLKWPANIRSCFSVRTFRDIVWEPCFGRST